MTKHLNPFQEAAESVGATELQFRTIRAQLAQQIEAATGENVFDRIGAEVIKGYYVSDAATREALVAQTVKNILQIKGESAPVLSADEAETCPTTDSGAEKPFETVGADG